MNAPQIVSDRSELQELLYNWIKWLSTRKYYAQALPLGVLASLQIDRTPSRGEPDANNNSLCCAFNLVIAEAHKSEPEHLLPFMYVYFKENRPRPIKTLAYDLNIDADTVYQRAHNAGIKYLCHAKKLETLNAMLQREVEGYTD